MPYLKVVKPRKRNSFKETYNIFFLVFNMICVKPNLIVTQYKNHLTLCCNFGCCILPFTKRICMTKFAFLINNIRGGRIEPYNHCIHSIKVNFTCVKLNSFVKIAPENNHSNK